MTTARSANERIRRKLRKTRNSKNKNRRDKNIDIDDRLRIRKSSDNDPNRRQGNVSEEFLKFYKGHEVSDPNNYLFLVEKMIEIAIDAGGVCSFPFKLNRLCEMKDYINNS